MKDALIIGAAAIAVYAVWRFSQPAATSYPGAAGGAAAPPTVGQQLEQLVSGKTGVPVAQIGQLAQSAPTWLKVAVLPVGVTAVAQGVITHPVDTAKKIGSAASSAYHAIGSIF